jgi:hypothetical protein
MNKTVTLYDFRDAFQSIRPDKFSHEGLVALYDYLIQYEEDCGEEFELDVIAICCEFTEYKNLEEVKANYSSIDSLEDLYSDTTVIEIPGSDRLIIEDY